MDFSNPKKLKSQCKRMIKGLEAPKLTTEFQNPNRPELLKLAAGLSIQKDYSSLYSLLKGYYIKEQSNEDLEYQVILAAYNNKSYSECLFLAQDLLISRHTPEIFLILMKLCVNHLCLPEMSLYYNELAYEYHPSDPYITSARGVVYLYNAVISTYQQTKTKLLNQANEIFEISNSKGRYAILYKALVYAHLNKLPEAMQLASEGLRITMDPKYIALVALLMVGQEDFTGALAIIKRGIQANPCNILLYSVKLHCKYLMFEHTHDKEAIKKSICTLIRMCKENAEDINTTIAGVIKEESSNIDSGYFEDIFKDITGLSNENFQQVIKLCFKTAADVEDWDMAETILQQIIENKVESAIFVYYKTQNVEDLENFYENSWVCEVLAHAKYESGDKNAAISICKQGIRLRENSKKLWMLLGKIYKEQGRMEEAMDSFLAALNSVESNFSMIPIYLEDY